MNVSSYRYSGLIHKKTVGVTPGADKKGFVVSMKKCKHANRPINNSVRVTFKTGPRRSLKKLRNLLKDNKYRKDLTQVCHRSTIINHYFNIDYLMMMNINIFATNQDLRFYTLMRCSS